MRDSTADSHLRRPFCLPLVLLGEIPIWCRHRRTPRIMPSKGRGSAELFIYSNISLSASSLAQCERLLRHCGLCVACGKAEAPAGRTRCRRCALYASERTKKWLRKRRAGHTASPTLECLLTSFQRLDIAVAVTRQLRAIRTVSSHSCPIR